MATTDSSSRGKPALPPNDEPAGNQATKLDGPAFRALLNAALVWLDRHHEIVNALNVFPVPDGDTGTNMLLTMRSACQEVGEDNTGSVGEVARTAAHGALMGARGNSGVILSQILRGMARRLDGESTLTGPRFASALSEGSRIAYKGVNKPVEGTILTVAREAAAAAENAAGLDDDLAFVLDRTVRAADDAVANTPRLLPVLAQAGKVDSGGKGLYFLLEGMYRALSGETVAEQAGPAVEAVVAPARPAKGRRKLPAAVYGFDVQFLVENEALDIDAIRRKITSLGDYPLVEGDGQLVKVHVHVPDPGVVLSYAVSLGFVTDVVVENMDDMSIPEMPPGVDPVPPRFGGGVEGVVGGEASLPVEPIAWETAVSEGPGVVAVAPGSGLAQVFRSLGAQAVVAGGQTMNPSTQELLQAVQNLPYQEVIILPNNSNVIMTAQQAQALSSKSVVVVPSKTMPQGISALLALNPHTDLERNLAAMTAALAHVETGEVTQAVQDASFDGIQVRAGDIIGLHNDILTAKGAMAEDVVKELLVQMGAENLEILTLYYGKPVDGQQAEALRAELRETYPDQEIEIVDGGQPFYHYIISAE
ncbi:MAG TPA: DAK2 domain-containing protein [Anaerolineae bacterium]